MNNEPTPRGPDPDNPERAEIAERIEQADRFKGLIEKLGNARRNFLEERAKGMDIPKEQSNEAFKNFESDQIEIILSKILNSSSPWSKASESNTGAEGSDATRDTLIDTDQSTVLRGENTARSEDPLLDHSPQVESTMIYKINPTGRIERDVSTATEEITDHATPHPVHGVVNLPTGEPISQPEYASLETIELDSKQAEQFVDLFEKAIDGMIEVYKGPYWNISKNTHLDGEFVID